MNFEGKNPTCAQAKAGMNQASRHQNPWFPSVYALCSLVGTLLAFLTAVTNKTPGKYDKQSRKDLFFAYYSRVQSIKEGS